MYSNVFFFAYINKIGGVETMFWELARKYHQYDITIFYQSGDPQQLSRLKKYVRCVKFTGQMIECKRAFFNYDIRPFIDHVKAENYYQIIHANYELQKLTPYIDPRITDYIAVSEANAEVFRRYTGLECKVCANPLTLDPVVPPLFICAAQRMTAEKGFKRIKSLVNALDRTEIRYYFLIFTNTPQAISSPNVIYMQPRLDIRPFIAASDLFVAVSDSEGRCYSVGEKRGDGHGKLLITPVPSFYEQGCDDSNSILLEFDCSNLDEVIEQIREMYEAGKLQEDFKPAVCIDQWDEYLDHTESNYKAIIVRATTTWTDVHMSDALLGHIPVPGETWTVDEDRLAVLQGWEEQNHRKLIEIVQ